MKFFSFYISKLLILFFVYLSVGLLGVFLNITSGQSLVLWPAISVGLAALLLYGYRLWPAIFLASFCLPFFFDPQNLIRAFLIALISTVQPLVCYFILKKFIKFRNSFSRVHDVIGFSLIAVPIAAVVSAISLAPLLRSRISENIYASIWVSDITSYVVIVPFILLWYANPRINYSLTRGLELLALFLFSIICALLTFTNIFIEPGTMSYMAFLPVIWSAVRFGQRETAAIILLFCIVAMWSTMAGAGPFIGKKVNDTLLYLQGFINVLAIMSMMLAALIHERKELERRKDEFIGIASHELKTPLTSIKAYVQIIPRMIKQKEEKNALKYLKSTDEQLDKLTHLVSDLLNISKIQAGKLELREESFSLASLVDETVKTTHTLSKKHEVKVKGKITKNVYADKEKIGQVLSNLLSNAIKYSPDANIIIITLGQKKNFAYVEVKDFGVGIPRNKLYTVFNRFYQLEKKGKPRAAGFGLGLYIASEIIKLHKGEIWAESIEGKGSTFCFTLPTKTEN